jgi:hypothetical protein
MEHKLVVRPSSNVSKTRIVKFLRANGYQVSSDYVTTAQAKFKSPIRHLIAFGLLTDCDKHGQDRRPRGEKPKYIEKTLDSIRYEIASKVKAEIYHVGLPFRRATSGWAGGETFLNVKVGAPFASGESRKVWSRNGKWSGSNAHMSISVSPFWMQRVLQVPGLALAGGMLTTHAKLIEENLWEASWVKQGRGFDINSESGYIMKDGAEWYHAKTVQAVKQLKKRREGFAKRAEAGKRFGQVLREMTPEQISEKFGNLNITLRDSYRAGNCETGTMNFVNRYFPGRTEGAISELLSVGITDRFVMSAVKAAILRQSRTFNVEKNVL